MVVVVSGDPMLTPELSVPNNKFKLGGASRFGAIASPKMVVVLNEDPRLTPELFSPNSKVKLLRPSNFSTSVLPKMFVVVKNDPMLTSGLFVPTNKFVVESSSSTKTGLPRTIDDVFTVPRLRTAAEASIKLAVRLSNLASELKDESSVHKRPPCKTTGPKKVSVVPAGTVSSRALSK